MFDDLEPSAIAFFNDLSKRQLESLLLKEGPGGLDFLESVFKWRAKTLKRASEPTAPHLKLMQVQESLANVLGFPSTHALQQLLNSLRQAFEHTVPEQWPAVMKDREGQWEALVRLNHLAQNLKNSNLPPGDPLLNLLALVAKGMADTLSVAEAPLRDAVAMAWAEASSWEAFATRTPLDEPLEEPVLSFSVKGDPSSTTSEGFFHMSTVGHWIWDNVLGSDESADVFPETPEQAQARLEEVVQLIERVPDLYMAYATVSSIYESHYKALGEPWTTAQAVLAAGLTKAEELWPKGFKGTLPWRHMDNRPYLRMLHQQLRLELQTRWGWQFAQETARRLIRLNPEDPWIVDRAPLLIGVGAAKSTQKKLRSKTLKNRTPSGLLHLGFAILYEGDHREEGLAFFLESIFRTPEFGAVLVNNPNVRPVSRYARPLSYEDPGDEVSTLIYFLTEQPEVDQWLIEVLKDPELLETERRLGRLIENRRDPALSLNARVALIENWNSQMAEESQRLAKTLLERYPYPKSDI